MTDSPRIEDLRRRVERDPTSIAFAQLAEEYRRAGNCEKAIRVCEAGLVHHPAYISARVTLGRALFELNRLDEARAQFQHVVEAAPDNLAAVSKLADIDKRLGLGPEPESAPPPSPAGRAVVEANPALAELEAWLDVIDQERLKRASGNR